MKNTNDTPICYCCGKDATGGSAYYDLDGPPDYLCPSCSPEPPPRWVEPECPPDTPDLWDTCPIEYLTERGC